MAYPFPRLGSPQTPHFIKGMDSAGRSPTGRPYLGYMRIVCLAVLATVALITTVRHLSARSSKQLDRIPFAESQLSEWVCSSSLRSG